MIRRGRPVITPGEVAQRAGVALRTWRRRDQPEFEKRVRPLLEGRYIIYDLAQTLAYLDGKPIPALPAEDHPDDLLSDKDVAAALNVSVSTVQAYRAQGYLPQGTHPKDADGQDVTSIRVTPRRDVEQRRATLPADRTPGRRGRPVGSAAREEAAALLASGKARTGTDVNQAVGVSQRHGNRLLAEAGRTSARARRHDVQTTDRQQRQAAVAALLKKEPDLTLSQIAEKIGVSKTEAHRLVQALRTPEAQRDTDEA